MKSLLRTTAHCITTLYQLITDHDSREGKAIIRICLSVHLFPFYLLNRLTLPLNLSLYVCVGHDHSSSRLKVEVIGQGQYSAYMGTVTLETWSV